MLGDRACSSQRRWMGLQSGLVFRPVNFFFFFMGLTMCIWALSCWNRKDCSSKVESTLLSEILLYSVAFRFPFIKLKGLTQTIKQPLSTVGYIVYITDSDFTFNMRWMSVSYFKSCISIFESVQEPWKKPFFLTFFFVSLFLFFSYFFHSPFLWWHEIHQYTYC